MGNKISQPEMQAPVSAVLSVVSDALRASIESSQRNFGDGGVRLVYEDAAAAVLAALAAVPISGLVEALLDHAVVERE